MLRIFSTINIKEKIVLSGLSIFFFLSLARFIKSVKIAWYHFGGELLANFPFASKLRYINPDLFKDPLLYNAFEFPPGFPDLLPGAGYWFYGPVHHFWLLPLVLLAQDAAMFFRPVLIIYILLYIGVLVLLYKMIKDTSHSGFRNYLLLGFMFAIALGSFQFNDNLGQRNVEILELCLIIIAFYFLKNNKDYLGGGVLGLAAMTKFLPIIFLPYLLVKKRYRAAFGFFIVFALIAVVTQFTLGWENNALFKSHMATHVGVPGLSAFTGASYITHISHLRGSLYTFILTFFADIDMTSAIPIITYKVKSFFLPNWLFIITAGFISLFSFFTMYKNKKGNLLYEFSIVCLMMLLLTPRTNPHYYIFTLMAFISIIKVLLMLRPMSISRKVFLSIIFLVTLLLLGNIVPFSIYDRILPLESLAFHYFSTYGIFGLATFILWCTLMYLYIKDHHYSERKSGLRHE